MIRTKVKKLEIPRLLSANDGWGRPFLHKLQSKRFPSSQMSEFTRTLAKLQVMAVRCPAESANSLNLFCNTLITLHNDALDLLNHKYAAEVASVGADIEFRDARADIVELLLELADNSEKYLNYKDEKVTVKLPGSTIARMRRIAETPARFPEDAPKKRTPNGWKKATARARNANGAAGGGLFVAQTATGYGTYGTLATVAGGGGATVGTGGLALVGVAAAKTAAGHVLAGRSAFRTHKHIKELEQISDELLNYPFLGRRTETCHACHPLDPLSKSNEDHEYIAHVVLPYLIKQKKKKRRRKALAATPVVGGLEMVRGTRRALYKMWAGTKGKMRKDMATRLARHFLTHDCPLAQEIIAKLLSSREQMNWLKDKEEDAIVEVLMPKFKGS